MSRSLMTGITGLRTHQQKLDVVANNLANMNTVAFKTQSVVFSDLMYNTARGGSAASDTSGGVNPQAIGTGVQTAQISRNFSQGTFESTSEIFDFAIQGDGFFTLASPTGENVYTRAGSFALDSRSRLVDPATGFLVQRIGNLGEATDGGVAFQTVGEDFITVPLGSPIAGEPTGDVEFNGNLPSSSSPPVAEVLASFRGFVDTTTGNPVTGASLISDFSVNTTPYGAGDQLELAGTNPDGTSFSTTVPADTGTMQDIVDALNLAMSGATAALTADGTLTVTADTPGEAAMSLTLRDAAGNVGAGNYSSNSMFVNTNGSAGDTFELSMEVYDERGESHRVSFEFTKESDNGWGVLASISPDSGTLLDDSIFRFDL